MKQEFTARCRAFSNEGIRENRIMIAADRVSVYDSVVGHYTTCHSLSKATQRRLLKIAKA
jgi:hypothetical protein